MRAPQPGATPAELYAAALAMAEWADERGCDRIVLCEHHGSPDGYLPSPIVFASALASRTRKAQILIAAVLLPFYDPVRLAEEMNVLDIISQGRVSFVLAVGYRPEEFDHFGVSRSHRGRIAEENLELLLALRSGEPVHHQGRRIHVTPPPHTPGGPRITLGGASVAAAERAGRFGLDLLSNANVDGLREAYESAAQKAGRVPGFVALPDDSQPSVLFVADNVDQGWEDVGPYLLHDARMYSEWNPNDETTSMISHARTVEELRRSTGYGIASVEDAARIVASGEGLRLAPLCGGLPPELAWPYLRRAVEAANAEAQA